MRACVCMCVCVCAYVCARVFVRRRVWKSLKVAISGVIRIVVGRPEVMRTIFGWRRTTNTTYYYKLFSSIIVLAADDSQEKSIYKNKGMTLVSPVHKAGTRPLKRLGSF